MDFYLLNFTNGFNMVRNEFVKFCTLRLVRDESRFHRRFASYAGHGPRMGRDSFARLLDHFEQLIPSETVGVQPVAATPIVAPFVLEIDSSTRFISFLKLEPPRFKGTMGEDPQNFKKSMNEGSLSGHYS